MKKHVVVVRSSKAMIQKDFVVRNNKDLSTTEITCRLMSVYTTIKDAEAEITRLRQVVSALIARVQQDTATASGLEAVLDSRR